jgi:hypothetical protein
MHARHFTAARSLNANTMPGGNNGTEQLLNSDQRRMARKGSMPDANDRPDFSKLDTHDLKRFIILPEYKTLFCYIDTVRHTHKSHATTECSIPMEQKKVAN